MQVTAITMKKSPVFVSIISQVTPSESSVTKKVAYEPLFLAHLRDHLGVKGIKRVVMHEALTNVRPVIFLNFASGTPRTEVWRGLHGAATLQAQCGKIVIALGEDIDASNTDAVFWSMAYRANMGEDLHVAPYKAGGHGPKSAPKTSDSTLLIDATPKHPMPPFALPAREYMERAKVLWDELGSARADAAAAVVRLFARRLERDLGHLGETRRRRQMGRDRRGYVCPPQGRRHPRNPRPLREREGQEQVAPTSHRITRK